MRPRINTEPAFDPMTLFTSERPAVATPNSQAVPERRPPMFVAVPDRYPLRGPRISSTAARVTVITTSAMVVGVLIGFASGYLTSPGFNVPGATVPGATVPRATAPHAAVPQATPCRRPPHRRPPHRRPHPRRHQPRSTRPHHRSRRRLSIRHRARQTQAGRFRLHQSGNRAFRQRRRPSRGLKDRSWSCPVHQERTSRSTAALWGRRRCRFRT